LVEIIWFKLKKVNISLQYLNIIMKSINLGSIKKYNKISSKNFKDFQKLNWNFWKNVEILCIILISGIIIVQNFINYEQIFQNRVYIRYNNIKSNKIDLQFPNIKKNSSAVSTVFRLIRRNPCHLVYKSLY
jgi:cytochrome b subunit of formate dehydrogenase